MKKFWKRMTAFVLCLALLVPVVGTLPASAARTVTPEDLTRSAAVFDNSALHCSVVIISWHFFSETECLENPVPGDVPDVTLEYTDADGAAQTISIGKDKILQEIYVRDVPIFKTEQSAPQLFICLPGYLRLDILQSAVLSVSAGTFCTAKGEPFPAFSEPLSKAGSIKLDVQGKTQALPETYQAVEDEQMELSVSLKSSFLRQIWQEHYSWTDNGVPVEQNYTLRDAGQHTVRASLNKFVSEEITFTVLSRKDAFRVNTHNYSKLLGEAAKTVMEGVPLFLLGFAGGIAWVWGGLGLAAGLDVFYCFFCSLFRTRLITVEHIYTPPAASA